MRIAAGVILIVAALFNGCAGSLYGFGGAVASKGATFLEEASKKAAEDNKDMTVDQKANLAKFSSAMGEGKGWGAGLAAFGFFLFAVLGLQIGGAVVLFMGKAKNFVIAVGAIGLIAEIVGMVLTSSIPGGGFKWTNLFGLLGSILAIVAALQYGRSQASAAPPAAAA